MIDMSNGYDRLSAASTRTSLAWLHAEDGLAHSNELLVCGPRGHRRALVVPLGQVLFKVHPADLKLARPGEDGVIVHLPAGRYAAI